MTDLQILAAVVVLTWIQIMAAAQIKGMAAGSMKWAFGNRETEPALSPFAGRVERAAKNMQENLPLFTAILLAAHFAGHAPDRVLLGAEVFLGARLVYVALYYAGVQYLRTMVWFVSVIGMGIIASTML